MGLFFVFSNLWSKNYNRTKEGMWTNFGILLPVFQAGDRISHKQWDEFLLENICAQVFPLLPRAPPAFLSVWFVRFYSVLSAETPTSLGARFDSRLCNPGVSVPPSSAGGHKFKFCQSEKRDFGSCASHNTRNLANLPIFCEKYINEKGF